MAVSFVSTCHLPTVMSICQTYLLRIVINSLALDGNSLNPCIEDNQQQKNIPGRFELTELNHHKQNTTTCTLNMIRW
jgi:hypothetical protein